MPRKYTSETVIKKLEAAAKDISTLYKSDIINYNGTTSDTNQPYMEVISEWLLEHFDILDKIKQVTRKKPYYCGGHTGNVKGAKRTNREEERLAKEFLWLESDDVGVVYDYQVPLKDTLEDKGLGKIDLVSYSTGSKNVYLLELKRQDSKETLLRCALEIYTYWKQLNHDKLITDFAKEYSEWGKARKIVPAILVAHHGHQHGHFASSDYPQTQKLIQKLGIEFCVFGYDISRID